MEIGKRAAAGRGDETPVLVSASSIAGYLSPLTVGLEVEKFWVLCLNRKNRLLKRVEVTSGTATETLAHPREVFRAAIREGACGVVVAHNHPSGDPSPSQADLRVTRQLREASKAVEIELLDHLVIGRAGADPMGKGFYSFKEAGVL
jgi:DNA repair protein RadC